MRNVLRISGACLSAALLAGCLDDSARIERQRRLAEEQRARQDMEESLHRLEATCQGLERALDESRDETSLDRQRLARLEQEVRDLPSRLAVKREAPKAAEPKHAKTVEVKSDAADLARIQTALKRAGFDPGTADGKMGAKTLKALESFQKSNGLKPDGVVGAQTLAKLKPFLAEPEAAEPTPAE